MRVQMFAAALWLAAPLTVYGQELFTDSIVVRGDAESIVAPDAVVWVVSLERAAETGDGARTALDADTTRVREAAIEAGLREPDIAIARSSVRHADGRFVARRTVTLAQHDLNAATTLLDRLLALQPAKLTYRFEERHSDAIVQNTQQQAIANARLQAGDIARELGGTLGRVILVENAFGKAGAFGSQERFSTRKSTPLEFVSAETFANAKIRVRASVYVTYAIGTAMASAE